MHMDVTCFSEIYQTCKYDILFLMKRKRFKTYKEVQNCECSKGSQLAAYCAFSRVHSNALKIIIGADYIEVALILRSVCSDLCVCVWVSGCVLGVYP